VLLRRLRDALEPVEAPAESLLGELEHVLALHERTRDRLLGSVEVALGRDHVRPEQLLYAVPVPSRRFPAAPGRLNLDIVGETNLSLAALDEPIALRGDELRLVGWAHDGEHPPESVDLFVVLEAVKGKSDRVLRILTRAERADVADAFEGYPANCGFDTTVNVAGLPAGVYDVVIVQSGPGATYRNETGVRVERKGAPCSNA
jgi:hypothetical protein